jgi:hypothetical protein
MPAVAKGLAKKRRRREGQGRGGEIRNPKAHARDIGGRFVDAHRVAFFISLVLGEHTPQIRHACFGTSVGLFARASLPRTLLFTGIWVRGVWSNPPVLFG